MREQGEIHRHSGWLIPLGFFSTVIILSGIFLLYYLRPAPSAFRNNRPTSAATRVAINVRGLRLAVPANYLESRRAQNGGDVDTLALFALLPDMRGYSDADSPLFAGNAADSAVLHLLIKADTNGLNAGSRFERIYKPYILDPAGAAAPYGLTRYAFRADSGYSRSDLFAGTDAPRGALLLLCEHPAQDISSPNCLAIDRPIAPGVNLSYRFKLAQLARWREINSGAGDLVETFLVH